MLPSCKLASSGRSLSYMTHLPTSGWLTATSVTPLVAVEDFRFSVFCCIAIAIRRADELIVDLRQQSFHHLHILMLRTTLHLGSFACLSVYCIVLVRPTRVVLFDVMPGSLAVWTLVVVTINIKSCLLSKIQIQITYIVKLTCLSQLVYIYIYIYIYI